MVRLSEIITPYKSLQKRFGNSIQIDTLTGVGIVQKLEGAPSFAQVAAQAKKADIIIFVGGISADYEAKPVMPELPVTVGLPAVTVQR